MLLRLSPLALALVLAACGGGNAPRFIVEAAPETTTGTPAVTRLRVGTIEIREVALPAYGEGSQILIEGADGGLTALRGGQWADGSPRAITAEIARSLDLRGSATVAAEPWPLMDGPAIRIETRIERLVARADGRFQLAGQYAVASPDGRMREFIERFDIAVPLADQGPAGVAAAYGRALEALTAQMARRLAR